MLVSSSKCITCSKFGRAAKKCHRRVICSIVGGWDNNSSGSMSVARDSLSAVIGGVRVQILTIVFNRCLIVLRRRELCGVRKSGCLAISKQAMSGRIFQNHFEITNYLKNTLFDTSIPR